MVPETLGVRKERIELTYVDRRLRLKCSSCGHLNRVLVNKAFFEPHDQPEPEVKVMIPMFQPQQVTKCEKRNRIL